MCKSAACAAALTLLLVSPVSAQSTSDLLKLSDSLNDMCRDGAGTKTEKACESRDLVDQMLRTRNVCFGTLGKVQRCGPGAAATRQGNQENALPARDPAATSSGGGCQRFAENQVVEAKGFVVAFEYAAEETKPETINAVVLDKPICFEKDEGTHLRVIMLDIKRTRLLGRHSSIKMRMIAGDSWSGSVQKMSEDKEIPD